MEQQPWKSTAEASHENTRSPGIERGNCPKSGPPQRRGPRGDRVRGGGHARAPEARTSDAEDIFAEMQPFMVNVPNVDDSREAIYTQMEGEGEQLR
jgi:hypothetical protein